MNLIEVKYFWTMSHSTFQLFINVYTCETWETISISYQQLIHFFHSLHIEVEEWNSIWQSKFNPILITFLCYFIFLLLLFCWCCCVACGEFLKAIKVNKITKKSTFDESLLHQRWNHVEFNSNCDINVQMKHQKKNIQYCAKLV